MNYGTLFVGPIPVRIRSKFTACVLVAMGILSTVGVVPSPINTLVAEAFIATQLNIPAPPSTDEVLCVKSEDSITTIDLDNGKLLLVFDKNGETKLPSEIVVGGRTLLANPGQNQIAQAE